MKINRNSWHFKLYEFNLQLIAAWRGHDWYFEVKGKDTIGLCPYVRTIILWGPLIMATYVLTLYIVTLPFVFFPIAMGTGLGGSIAVIGTIFLFILTLFLLDKYIGYRNKKKDDEEIPDWQSEEKDKTFGTVFWEYIKSFKTKICPVLEVKD